MIKNLGWSAEELMFKLTTGALPGPDAWKPMTPAYRAALLAEMSNSATLPPDQGRLNTESGGNSASAAAAGGYTAGGDQFAGADSAPGWREAAVLILLFPATASLEEPGSRHSDEPDHANVPGHPAATHPGLPAALPTGLYFPLIVRTEDGGVHSGQLALPGGALEPGESAEQAALRECLEELGIPTDAIRVLRRLTRLPVPPSRYIITPVLAIMDSKPEYRPSEHEVRQVLDCPLKLLLDEAARGSTRRSYKSSSHAVPCFRLQEHEIWGATAMILAELAALAAPPGQTGGN